ncbi:PREDICTED: nuclear receptor subfamily 2 group E member 1-like [Priapulus caudatus]|uniref:Nuclear receptor subfamily 2 group E member 1-like n=1 Tax=Priapulus caudatus TaxID=37621 RepID=A0ABM1E716_PRICU|nr:PREDICTED: nuclear receptor subfamily 2 group E member 1-like [Priapulus caudatus]
MGERLLDIACSVCGDRSSGKHYGIYSCDGCSGFFKRSIHRQRVYTCKAVGDLKGHCPIDKTHRNQCRACRLTKCFDASMNKDAVQHERGPRKPKLSTLESPSTSKVQVKDSGQSMVTSTTGVSDLDVMFRTLTAIEKLHAVVPSEDEISRLGRSVLLDSRSASTLFPKSLCTIDALQEIAARLLFTLIRWTKVLPPFQNLCKHDQVILLEETWKDIFLLSLAQWTAACNLAATIQLERAHTPFTVTRHVREILLRFQHNRVDGTEFACLKTTTLFRSETIGLSEPQKVELVQDQAQMLLGEYIHQNYASQPTRFGRLLLLLPSLKGVSCHLVEEIFFKETIGSIPLERLVVDIYQQEKCDITLSGD